ncbi:hypothetical protein K2X40_05145 [Candidatus Babeliales bacterium]|nr:hypothetical protein [Candidatus Babeliales bacterium]MBY0353524.1 hypothetical protein [Candidatus Babeliales bacterium]
MKRCSYLFICLALSGCAKKKNTVKTAQIDYKLALIEISEAAPNSLKKALTLVEKALKNDQNPRYMALKATILFSLQHEQESLLLFKQALAACKDQVLHAEIMNNYACALAQTGKESEALGIWQQLENDRHYLTPEVALVNQARVFGARGDSERAKKLLMQATALAPSYIDAHYFLALIANQLNEPGLTKNQLKTVLFLEPGHEGAQYLSGQLGLLV